MSQLNINRDIPLVFDQKLTGSRRYRLECDVRIDESPRRDAAVAVFDFFDSSGQLMPGPHPGFSISRSFEAYRYYPCTPIGMENRQGLTIETPRGATSVTVRLMPWKCEKLLLYKEPALRDLQAPLHPAEERRPSPPKPVAPSQPEPQAKAQPARTQGVLLSELRLEVEDGRTYLFSAEVEASGAVDDRPAILTAVFRDSRYSEIAGPYPGFARSPTVGQYRYVALKKQQGNFQISELVEPPPGAALLRLSVKSWNAKLTLLGAPTVTGLLWEEFIDRLELDEEPEATLRRLADLSVQRGDLAATVKLREAIFRRTRREADAHRLRVVRGMATELSPLWLPRIAKRQSFLPQTDHDKICHIFKVLYPQESTGGAVRNWSILRSQVGAGLSPVACLPLSAEPFPRADAPDDRDGVEEFTRDGVLIAAPRYRAFDRSRLSADLLLEVETALYADVVSRHRCSIVHATSGFKGFDNALKGMALARKFGLPFIYEVRSFHEHTWGPLGPSTLAAPLTRLRSTQENRCMAAADVVITISEAMIEELVSRGIRRESLRLIPNSVDDEFLMPIDNAVAEEARDRYMLRGKTVIGYISNISRREGHEVLLRAFASLPDRYDAVCLMVGRGPEESRLRELAVELGVANRVVWAGEVDHASIREMYSLIDVFVVPRLPDYASDFVTPMKPFEALALGCKLIMADRPVSAEVVGNEERGLLFRTGDHHDLAQKILEVLDRPEAAIARAERGREWVRSYRTWRFNGGEYKRIYEAAREVAARRMRHHESEGASVSFRGESGD